MKNEENMWVQVRILQSAVDKLDQNEVQVMANDARNELSEEQTIWPSSDEFCPDIMPGHW